MFFLISSAECSNSIERIPDKVGGWDIIRLGQNIDSVFRSIDIPDHIIYVEDSISYLDMSQWFIPSNVYFERSFGFSDFYEKIW